MFAFTMTLGQECWFRTTGPLKQHKSSVCPTCYISFVNRGSGLEPCRGCHGRFHGGCTDRQNPESRGEDAWWLCRNCAAWD